jgi:hypothetical protein
MLDPAVMSSRMSRLRRTCAWTTGPPIEGAVVKYVILIHSNPEPWGHPTQIYTEEGRALPQDAHDAMDREFDALIREISDSGELVVAEALADPASSTLYRWTPERHLATDGPYAETKEHLAGFFLIDVASQERAEQICESFNGPGETVELRPGWTGGAA